MAHLEDLLVEYYDWCGYVVKRCIKVGRLPHGDWEMELDVLAHHPHTGHLIHLEPSLDARTWARREERFGKKFAAGRKYIFSDVFTWLDEQTPIDQVAMLVSHPKKPGHARRCTNSERRRVHGRATQRSAGGGQGVKESYSGAIPSVENTPVSTERILSFADN